MNFFFKQPKSKRKALPKQFEAYEENSLHVLKDEVSPAPTAPAVEKSLLDSMLASKTATDSRITWYSQNSSPANKGAEPEQDVLSRSISIEIRKILDRIPPDLLGEGPHDGTKRIQFKVKELATHVVQRNPVMMLSTIARACPHLFDGEIQPDRDLGIYFPWHEFVGKLKVGVMLPLKREAGKSSSARLRSGIQNSLPLSEEAGVADAVESIPVNAGGEGKESRTSTPAPRQTVPEGVRPHQPITGETPSLEVITMERDEAIRQRDEALCEVERLKMVLGQISGDPKAVQNTPETEPGKA